MSPARTAAKSASAKGSAPAAELTVPAVGKFRPHRLPAVAEVTLANGLRVLAVRKPGIPMVQARMSLPTAIPKAPATDNARERMLGGTLLSGTTGRDSVDIAEALQGMGGTLDTSAGTDGLHVRGSALAPSLGDLVSMIAEILTDASFPKAEVQVERARKQQEVLLQQADPGTLARIALFGRLYGTGHPYGEGLPETGDLAAVKPGDLRRYLKDRVNPKGGILILVGDLRPDRALAAAEAALAGWEGPKRASKLPKPDPIAPGPLVLVDRPGAAQSNIRLAGPALTRLDPGLPALLLANTIFGGYFSSRLVENIRENKGYTYSPRSGLEHLQAASIFSVTADVATDVTAPALLEILYELGRMSAVPVADTELEAAKRYLIGSTALSTQTQAGLANYLFALTLSGLGFDYLRELPGRVEAVTTEQVLEISATHLAPNKLVKVVLGDAGQVRGPVETLVDVVTG